jgi:hypothetical protein
MICKPCADRDHASCRVGCACQHKGSGVLYVNGAARHALAMGWPLPLADGTPPTIKISTNGERP